MKTGLLYQLGSVPWDWFGTLTFGLRKVPVESVNAETGEVEKKFKIVGGRVPPVADRYSMFFQWLRAQEKHWNLKYTQWILRHEKGEVGERPHFHFLIRGLPKGANTRHFRLAAMNRWELLGGGMARIRWFDNVDHGGEKDAVGYVLKNLGANAYELGKFELEGTDLKLSPALLLALQEKAKRITV